MTTINNDQSLIKKVGGIDRAIALEAMLQKHAVPESWKISIINGMWHRSSVGFTHSDLRTAIASHEPKMHSHLTSDALQGDDTAKHDFNVGDKVIRLDLNSPHIYSIHKIEDGVYTIARKVRHRTWGTWLECSQIRHATPSEIKAGHRLEAERHG